MIKYLVSEIVDEDGGFGDCIETQVPLAVFDNQDDAKNYVRKHSNQKVYDVPYDELFFGALIVQEVVYNISIDTSVKDLPNYDDRDGDGWFLREDEDHE